MDYLAKFYKNQSEVLSEQIKALEAQLEQLMESEAPASIFRGTGEGQFRFGDLELENQMRRYKKHGFLGAEVPDEKQSREYLDAKAELERRRGAKQAPAQAPAQAPTPAPARRPAPAPRPPVEQTGPVGSPSAVPTRTEVQRTQAVADTTQKPTALPTNTAPGTMHMTDMDGNPIAVQPKAPKMDPVEFAAHAAEAGGDYKKDKSGYIQSRVEPEVNYTSYNVQKSIPGKPPASSTAAGAAGMVSRAFSIPAVAPGTVQKPSDIHGGRLKPGFHDGRIEPKVDADVQASAPPGRWSSNWNEFIDAMRPRTMTGDQVPASLYGTPPSAQFAPTSSSLETSSPAIGQAVKPSEIKNTPRPDQAAIDSAARQALPSPVRGATKPVSKPTPQAGLPADLIAKYEKEGRYIVPESQLWNQMSKEQQRAMTRRAIERNEAHKFFGGRQAEKGGFLGIGAEKTGRFSTDYSGLDAQSQNRIAKMLNALLDSQ